MFRSIVIILVVILVMVLWVRYKKLKPAQRKAFIKKVVIAALIGGLLLLALMGKFNWLLAAAGALLTMAPRAMRFFGGVWPTAMPYFKRYQQNQQSNMRSRYIQLQIDMLSGALQGDVLDGEFSGKALNDLSLDQLMQLLTECKHNDDESATLLIAYLDRQHTGWNNNSEHDEHASYRQATSDATMSEKQAREILGVNDTAGKKDITNAHRKLIQKMHPDRGGSDFLAQQVNKARDVLLKNK